MDRNDLWYEFEGKLVERFSTDCWLLDEMTKGCRCLVVRGAQHRVIISPILRAHSIIHHVTRHGRLRKPTRQTGAHEYQKEEPHKYPPRLLLFLPVYHKIGDWWLTVPVSTNGFQCPEGGVIRGLLQREATSNWEDNHLNFGHDPPPPTLPRWPPLQFYIQQKQPKKTARNLRNVWNWNLPYLPTSDVTKLFKSLHRIHYFPSVPTRNESFI